MARRSGTRCSRSRRSCRPLLPAIAVDSGLPEPWQRPGLRYVGASDEHGARHDAVIATYGLA